MRNYVIINGINSLDIQGLAINNLPPITKPMIRTQREEIDGRDGDIVTELGYSAYDKSMEIGLYGNFDIDEIIKYFTGEGTIVFSNEDDKYYNFKILDQIDYEKLLKFKTATITMHCQPFKYPLEEEPVEAEIKTITGTGESITLEDTEKAPMEIVYKGNTYQYSTSGKNLLNIPDGTQESNGITFVALNGEITINGTATGNAFYQLEINIPVTAEKYSWSANNPVANENVTIRLDGNLMSRALFNVNQTWSATFDSAGTRTYFVIRVASGTTLTNFKIKPQLEKGDPTSYEPYTNGASPNPDYPQEIQVVSGDNTIEVCGKNHFDYASASNVNNTKLSQYRVFRVGGLKPNSRYNINNIGFTSTIANTYVYMWSTDQYSTSTRYRILTPTDYSNKITFNSSDNGDMYLAISPTDTTTWENIIQYFSNAQIEEGGEATTYEPFTGASYSINLPVENFFDISRLEVGNATISGNTITMSGSSDYHSIPNGLYLKDFTDMKAGGTYTLSFITTYTSSNKIYLRGSNSSWNNGESHTITQQELDDRIAFYGVNGDTIKNIQIEKGTKANHYTPYGTTPIWLGWIRNTNYRDKIDKSTGKNLFNGVMELGIYDGDTGQPVSNNSYMRCKDYIPVDEQTKYVITSVDLSVELAVYEYKGDYSYNLTTNRVLQNGQSFTTNSGTKYIKFRPRVANTDLTSKFMVNKGTTALPYEPYGTSWYLKKEIGKVVLNGSETWNEVWRDANTTHTFTTTISTLNSIFAEGGTKVDNCRSIMFKGTAYDGATNSIYNNRADSNQEKYLIAIGDKPANKNSIYLKDYDYTTTTDLKTWFSTHNTEVYYVLETPTYTLIEGELLNQLEAIKMSYEGQTNLSQTNNDLPFELDASVTFLTPMEINNIGNIYAKPILTIEGTGNIGVVLNGIQILEIDLSNNGKITIDVPKLEAYDPDDDTLLNRLVTGDYMKLLINEGENKITFTGEVSGATLTNYIRWI